MEYLNHDIITKIINKGINLFEFINIDKKYISNDVLFTEKYYSALKRAFKRNSIKYHPDKCINASDIEKEELEYNFNLNQIIYTILSSQSNYTQYKECEKLLSIKSHDSLKSSFKTLHSNQDIKNLIKESTGGRSYHELAAEKDKLHGIDKTYDSKDVSKSYQKLLKDRDIILNEVLKNTKKIDFESDSTFVNTFNKQFDLTLNKEDNNVKQNIMEIQPYNSSDKTIICGSFDYQNFNYSDLYAPTNGSELEESFKLLSCNIPSKYENNLSLDERIKEYEKNTKQFANMITNED